MPVKNKLKISLKCSEKGYQNKPKKQKEKINKNKRIYSELGNKNDLKIILKYQ